MNSKAFRSIVALILLCISASAFCQSGASFSSETTFAAIGNPPVKAAHSPVAARTHKRFPQLFTGMAIEIATSTYPMDKTNPLFRQFGNILYEKLPEGGYSYLIMANFSSMAAGLDFVKNMVRPKAEKARLIQYTEGNRKVIRE